MNGTGGGFGEAGTQRRYEDSTESQKIMEGAVEEVASELGFEVRL